MTPPRPQGSKPYVDPPLEPKIFVNVQGESVPVYQASVLLGVDADGNPVLMPADPNAALVSEVQKRFNIEVPSDILFSEHSVAALLVAVNFSSAESVEVRNCPNIGGPSSYVDVWFKKPDTSLLGPYRLAAYAKKKLAIQGGFIGIELVSDVTGTDVSIERFINA